MPSISFLTPILSYGFMNWFQEKHHIISNVTVAGNELWRILLLFAILLAALIVGRFLKYLFHKGAQKAESRNNDILSVSQVALAKSSLFILFSFGLKAGLSVILLSASIKGIVDTSSSVLIILGIGYGIYNLVDVVDVWLRRFTKSTKSQLDDMLAPLVVKSLKVTVAILTLLQVAQMLSNKPITSILAGLGVGGLAVALAAQDTIRNFFGSLVIFSDKPFEVGDRINVQGFDGPVEEVGFRSTRIRTLDGHLVSIPNGELANMSIQNIGKRPYIKRVMTITVTYDTSPEKLQKAVDIVKEILQNHEGMDPEFPPRIYFSDFASVSLNIVVYYWYHPADYWKFMEFNERVNFEILRRYNSEGIDFAFPTQTIYVAGDDSRPIKIENLRDSLRNNKNT